VKLYVETVIRAPMDELWRHTQDPDLHQRWDGRFGRISYVPGTDPQELRYVKLGVAGTGTTVGDRTRSDGGRTSSITFSSRSRLSPLRSGAGFWRYEPTPFGIRFLTGYDYKPGWGRLPDTIVRPLMGWLTAWSFDRLRLWLENGTAPERLRNRAIAELIVRAAAVLAATAIGPFIAASVAAAALLVPPLPGTPAARRCLRSPRAATSQTMS
jgi:hypothetical protein